MGLESATFIHQLNAGWPVGPADPKGQGDDHIRMIKSTLQATFPNITGVVTASHTQLNGVVTAAAPSIDVSLAAPSAGSATTFIRTDAQIRLAQNIVPTWTGLHKFASSSGEVRINGDSGFLSFYNSADSIRRGYLQAVTGGHLLLYSEASGQNISLQTNGGVVAANSPLHASDGSSGAPSVSFSNDSDSGRFRSGSNAFDDVAGGVVVARYSYGGVTAQFQAANGSAALPGISLLADNNSGLYSGGSGVIGLSISGTLRTQWSASSFILRLQQLSPDGSAASPQYSFESQANSGVYLISAGKLGFSEAGTGYRIGFRQVPRSTTSTTLTAEDLGKCVAVSAAINIPASVFSTGDCLSIYNDSAASVNITISAGTLRLAGTTTTGTRALAARGMATLWFNSGGATPEVIASGPGVS